MSSFVLCRCDCIEGFEAVGSEGEMYCDGINECDDEVNRQECEDEDPNSVCRDTAFVDFFVSLNYTSEFIKSTKEQKLCNIATHFFKHNVYTKEIRNIKNETLSRKSTTSDALL